MAELKPFCPVCGSKEFSFCVSGIFGNSYHCLECKSDISEEVWNTRPRENQIKQEYREKCALICDEIAVKHWQDYKGGPNRADLHYQGLSDGADECAIAIRNMEGT